MGSLSLRCSAAEIAPRLQSMGPKKAIGCAFSDRPVAM